jgi:hypothetical protein
MSIAELGAIGEFVASFGVIATLIYLAIQMRQNTQAVRLNTAQVFTEELQQMFSLLASDEGLSTVFVEAGRCQYGLCIFPSKLAESSSGRLPCSTRSSLSAARWRWPAG